MSTEIGTISWFNVRKRFGVIETVDGDLFFHGSAVIENVDSDILDKGGKNIKVSFDRGEKFGKPCAVNVRII